MAPAAPVLDMKACIWPRVSLLLRVYGYLPNEGAAYFASALFFVLTVVSIPGIFKTRAWFLSMVTLTAALECAGYVTRVLMIEDTPCKIISGYYVSTTLFLIITPTLLAVVVYVLVGKLLAMASEQRIGFLRSKHIITLFTISDVITLGIQGVAGGMISSSDLATLDRGRKLMLSGLVTQLGFFAMFTYIAVYLHVHAARFGLKGRVGFRRLLTAMYGSMLLLTIRNVYRVVEYVDMMTHHEKHGEDVFYGFDTIPIALAIVLLVVLHPGYLLEKMRGSKGVEDEESVGGSGMQVQVGKGGKEVELCAVGGLQAPAQHAVVGKNDGKEVGVTQQESGGVSSNGSSSSSVRVLGSVVAH